MLHYGRYCTLIYGGEDEAVGDRRVIRRSRVEHHRRREDGGRQGVHREHRGHRREFPRDAHMFDTAWLLLPSLIPSNAGIEKTTHFIFFTSATDEIRELNKVQQLSKPHTTVIDAFSGSEA